MAPNVNGKPLLGGEFRMSRVGAWHADVEADDEAVLSGLVQIELDGITFVGTALPGRAGLNGTRQVARIVGGRGGLSNQLDAKSYESPSGVKVGAIIADVLRDIGETLSTTSDAAILDTRVPRWHRSEGLASHLLVQLLEHVGAEWRMLADGTIWVGTATWPEVTVDHVLEDEDWAAGVFVIAPEAPDLVPGVTFLGQRIETVVHRLDREGKLRTDAHISSLRSAFQRMLGNISRQIDYSRVYRCRVVKQNADGTLQISPDDDTVKGRGLDRVPIWLGLPGYRVNVVKGAKCLLMFLNGQPDLPFVFGWQTDGSDNLTSVEFMKNGRSAPFARVGDSVKVLIPYTPVLSSPIPFPVVAVIETGNPATIG